MSNSICVVGRLTRIRKTCISEKTAAYNFGIACENGFGEAKKTVFFEASAFADRGAQELLYDSMLVKGRKLPVSGYMTTGTPYKNSAGAEITPWILQVLQIGTGINHVTIVGNIADDAVVTTKNDSVIVRLELKVQKKGGGYNTVHIVKYGTGRFKDYARKYLVKGRSVIVFGSVSSDLKSSGTSDEVIASNIELYNENGINPLRKQPLLYDPDIPEELLCEGIFCGDEFIH